MNQHKFNADIAEVFNIVTANVYKNHEVFLRELISNASDACEKLYLESNLGNAEIKNRNDLKIQITISKDNKTIIIQDNGIGMNEADIMNNLGMIASSGTKKFFKEKLGEKKSESNLIGQFGIGFYSAFLVADNVTVESKKFDSEKAYLWTSTGVEGFDIAEHNLDFTHGTKITLTIKETKDEYLDKHRIKHLIELYSKNIPFDIVLQEENQESELINEEKALWTKDKNAITKEEHSKFFKEIGGIYGNPWLTMHSRVEGESNYSYLLYVPEMKPFNMFDPDRKTSVKLHVNKIFITEEADLMPKYLRFIRGIVDSYDLPLNVSRETVQQSYLISKMKQYLTKKILGELKYAASENKEEYNNIFWNNFGAVLKEGLCEGLNTEARETLLELCRFRTSKSGDQLISLEEYLANMPANQSEIFYFTGESTEAMMRNPQMEGFAKRDIEVILLTDGVDDFWLNVVLDYKEKKFKSISQSDINLDEIKTIEKTEEETSGAIEDEQLGNLVTYFKEILSDAVEDVLISKKLANSPACLGLKEGQMNMKMERFLMDQKQLSGKSQKIFEINKDHALIKKINNSYCATGASDELRNTILNLFDFICIIEGESLHDNSGFSTRANRILENLMV